MVTRRQVMKTLALGSTILTADFIQGISFAACSAPAATIDSSLDAAFKQAVTAFNAHDPTIGGLLAPGVILNTVSEKHDAGSGQKTKVAIFGKANVVNYFRTSFSDSPTFTPNPDYTHFSYGRRGIVSGTACWSDNNNADGPETISFMFQWVNPGSGWLIKHLYAD
jgi:hypothetical protein